MPFYEYQCKSCGHALEAMQKVNDAPLKKCPECGKSQLTRLMSAPVFRLKGGGWYETDFKGDQDAKKNLADRPEAEPAKDEKKASETAKGGEAGGEPAKPTEKPVEKVAAAAPSAAAPKPPATRSSKRGLAATPVTGRVGAKAAAKPVKKPAVKAKKRG